MRIEDGEELDRIRRIVALQPNHRWWPVDFLLDLFDRRVVELLKANSKLVTERRVAEGQATHWSQAVDFLLRHNGMKQLREMEAQVRILTHERDEARHEAMTAWAQAQMHMENAARSKEDRRITDVARAWGRSIHTLRMAMKPNSKGNRGDVTGANRAYTEAHLALLAALSDHRTEE